MRPDEGRVRDMLEAIGRIERRATNRQDFDADELVRVWCLHHLVVLGEAAARVTEALQERHPAVPWRGVIGMRNAVVHGYFRVDWDEVWTAVEKDLGPLRQALEELLGAEDWGG